MEKLYIIKIGGNIIDDISELTRFLADFASIKEHKILVHGGGKMVSDLAQKLEVPQSLVDGRRVTNKETLKIATMVYAGLINKQIVAQLQSHGVNAAGFSGADMNLITARKRNHPEIDFGFVGDIIENGINTKAISQMISNNIVPVFCSITHDGKGQLLNTNADTIASTLGIALSKSFTVQLNYCFEQKGVMKDITDQNSVIETINKLSYQKLLEKGSFSKGMIPKLDNAFNAIDNGVSCVKIGHSHDLINMLNENENAGTKLIA